MIAFIIITYFEIKIDPVRGKRNEANKKINCGRFQNEVKKSLKIEDWNM